MIKGQPSALEMPEWKKQQTIDAVYDAIGIVNKRKKEFSHLNVGIWSDAQEFLMVSKYNDYLSKVIIALIVGRSQQRFLKRRRRRSEVWFESQKIANETGASVEDVNDEFLTSMSHYINTKYL
jgi:hypothetical protein